MAQVVQHLTCKIKSTFGDEIRHSYVNVGNYESSILKTRFVSFRTHAKLLV